ncbi:MAG: hypothetical protein AB7O52_02635 [Planctomycetota bacterium]
MDVKSVFSKDELLIVLACLEFIQRCEHIGEYEFLARLGVTKQEFDNIVASWPEPPRGCREGWWQVARRALLEVSYGITFEPGEWEVCFRYPRNRIQALYERVADSLR